MKRSALTGFLAIGAILVATNLLTSTFVPPARRSTGSAAMLGAAAAASMGAAPAFADEIGEAAKKFAKASYPFLKEVNWNSGLFNENPGKASPAEWTKAIAKAIDMGVSMDPELLTLGVRAHHAAIGSMDSNLVTSLKDYEGTLAAIGRMIASAPEAKTMAVYDSFSKLVDPAVPKYLMGTVNEGDALAAYFGFMEFKDVVKAHPIKASTAVSTKAFNPVLDTAAKKLAEASYPFLKEIDWSSKVSVSPTGFTGTPAQLTKAVDKVLVMGAAMDGLELRNAAQAHVKAIDGMDASGVATKADYEAILLGIGKTVATVPARNVLDVFNAFKDVTSPQVPGYLMSTVQSADAAAAYKGFLEFKDAVKVAGSR